MIKKRQMTREQFQTWLGKKYHKNARQLGLDAQISTQSAYQILNGKNFMKPENLNNLGVTVLYLVEEI